jgi:PASTA domain
MHIRTPCTQTRPRVLPVVAVCALLCSMSACAATPGISARPHGVGAGTVERPPTSVTIATTSTSTSTTIVAPLSPTGSPQEGKGQTRPGESGSATTTTTLAVPSTSTPGSPPDVVGQSLATAEENLQAAGLSTAAHPWGGSCSATNQVMQQVPPSNGEVQLYYCPGSS